MHTTDDLLLLFQIPASDFLFFSPITIRLLDESIYAQRVHFSLYSYLTHFIAIFESSHRKKNNSPTEHRFFADGHSSISDNATKPLSDFLCWYLDRSVYVASSIFTPLRLGNQPLGRLFAFPFGPLPPLVHFPPTRIVLHGVYAQSPSRWRCTSRTI